MIHKIYTLFTLIQHLKYCYRDVKAITKQKQTKLKYTYIELDPCNKVGRYLSKHFTNSAWGKHTEAKNRSRIIMWDLILASTCWHLYKSTATYVYQLECVNHLPSFGFSERRTQEYHEGWHSGINGATPGVRWQTLGGGRARRYGNQRILGQKRSLQSSFTGTCLNLFRSSYVLLGGSVTDLPWA